MVVDRLHLADDDSQPDLSALLSEQGIEAVILSREADLDSIGADFLPHLALMDLASMPESDLRHCVHKCS